MQRIMLALCVSVSLVNIAHSASKLTVRRDDDKTVSIVTRELRTSVFDYSMHRIREPAPPNACPRLAFEILNPLPNEQRCVNLR